MDTPNHVAVLTAQLQQWAIISCLEFSLRLFVYGKEFSESGKAARFQFVSARHLARYLVYPCFLRHCTINFAESVKGER